MTRADARPQPSRRVLDPVERVAEWLFGLIMVLTFTGSLSVATAGRDDVRAMLIGALGCNLAWGIIDGVLYLMASLADRRREVLAWHAIREAQDPGRAQALVAEALPSFVASALEPEDLRRVSERVRAAQEPPQHARLTVRDWYGALGVFLIVFLSTLPVAMPFIFLRSTWTAMRVSNTVALVMLFLAGVAYGRTVGRAPWLLGVLMVALGSVLVALTIALGG